MVLRNACLELLQEVLHEQRDVLLPLAQRRQLHRDHVQPVVQVLAELAVCDHPSEVAVGGGDHAHVHLDRVRVADPLELALLQHPQQLHLQRRAHRPDFVEEQRAFVRLLEAALPVADRAGERPAHVAEELRFEQRFRNRAAVERDEAMHAPRAVVMDGPRDDFLPGARFARDENRAVRRGDRFEQLEQPRHRPALADHALEPVALLELRPQVGVLRFQPALFERRVEHVQQLIDLKGLADEVPGAALDGFDGVFHRPVPGDDDGDDVRIAFDGGFDDGGAVDAGEPEVGDDDVEGEIGESREGRLARIGLLDVVPAVGQLFGDGLAERRLVFDEQQMFRRISHLARRQYFDTKSGLRGQPHEVLKFRASVPKSLVPMSSDTLPGGNTRWNEKRFQS